MSRAGRDPRIVATPDTRSKPNTAAQQIISNAAGLRHEFSDPSEVRMDKLNKKNSMSMCKEERLKANEWKRQYEEERATDQLRL